MIVETTSDKLKGCIDEEVYLISGQHQFDELEPTDASENELPIAHVICGESLPFTKHFAPPEDEYPDRESWKFEPDAAKWIDELCDAAGVRASI
ncbi:MAG: hypothetical protein DMG96_29850 [Acidobacteria bacterium]|nr:MAG: hypothetical protein DMG96_29850 [Acidobacteriota bacterium]